MPNKSELEQQIVDLQTKLDGVQFELDSLKEAKSSTIDTETIQHAIDFHKTQSEQLRFQQKLYKEQNRRGHEMFGQRADTEDKIVHALQVAIRQ